MTQTTFPSHESTIPYATPMHAPTTYGRRIWAGFAILFSAICLVGLAGCFLIGVMMIVDPFAVGNPSGRRMSGLNPAQIVFVTILYICCFVSFGSACAMLVVGTRTLVQVARS